MMLCKFFCRHVVTWRGRIVYFSTESIFFLKLEHIFLPLCPCRRSSPPFCWCNLVLMSTKFHHILVLFYLSVSAFSIYLFFSKRNLQKCRKIEGERQTVNLRFSSSHFWDDSAKLNRVSFASWNWFKWSWLVFE